jgi:hypothetical protein
LLDQDAIPTLVEVKRSSNREIRRMVVGQMLDYAANAVLYWNLDDLRQKFEQRAQTDGNDAREVVADLLDEAETSYDEFWERAKSNLRDGRIRLVFVADVIPRELQRVVEFLNERMSPTEVLAIEVRQYTSQDEQVLVPRVLGQTAAAQQRKETTAGAAWDEASFIAELTQADGASAIVAKEILRWADNVPGAFFKYGAGAGKGSATLKLKTADQTYSPFRLWTDGNAVFLISALKTHPPFDAPSKRQQYIERLNQIDSVTLSPGDVDKKPKVPIATFADDETRTQLFAALTWVSEQTGGTRGSS